MDGARLSVQQEAVAEVGEHPEGEPFLLLSPAMGVPGLPVDERAGDGHFFVGGAPDRLLLVLDVHRNVSRLLLFEVQDGHDLVREASKLLQLLLLSHRRQQEFCLLRCPLRAPHVPLPPQDQPGVPSSPVVSFDPQGAKQLQRGIELAQPPAPRLRHSPCYQALHTRQLDLVGPREGGAAEDECTGCEGS
eukprot:107497-Hanusia_phi.AAC.1